VSRRSNLSSENPIPSLPSPILAWLEKAWRVGASLGEWRHQRKVHRGIWPLKLSVPVISIGNLTVGGTGKTPTIVCLARAWQKRGGHPGILSRGYKGGADGNDEYHMLKEQLPDVPHLQNPQRHKAGEQLLKAYPEVDLLFLDDGFQHRRLYRDLDVVLCDAKDPFGGGYCLPRGRLREPVTALTRAQHILLTRSERCTEIELKNVRGFFRQMFPTIPVSLARTEVVGLQKLSGEKLDQYPEGQFLPFSAIGDPSGFQHSLKSHGIQIHPSICFRDHHSFRSTDLATLERKSTELGAAGLICTLKDAVKIREMTLPAGLQNRVYVLEIRQNIDSTELLEGFRPGTPRGEVN